MNMALRGEGRLVARGVTEVHGSRTDPTAGRCRRARTWSSQAFAALRTGVVDRVVLDLSRTRWACRRTERDADYAEK
jgi:hypothetical protein